MLSPGDRGDDVGKLGSPSMRRPSLKTEEENGKQKPYLQASGEHPGLCTCTDDDDDDGVQENTETFTHRSS